MEKRRAVTFFIKYLADDQRSGSYCWKTPSSFPVHTGKHSQTHTHTPLKHTFQMHTSTTFLPPPSLSCFQTSVESCVPLSHLLSKVTIKDAEYMSVLRRVRWLLRKNFDWQTLSGDPEGRCSHCKRFIGKMHPRMLLGGSCPGAIIE